MSEAARIDLVDRAPLTEKQQNVYESIMQYQRVNGYAPTIAVPRWRKPLCWIGRFPPLAATRGYDMLVASGSK